MDRCCWRPERNGQLAPALSQIRMQNDETKATTEKSGPFYSPVVIAVYCVLFLPIGALLMGLNHWRRNRRGMGVVLLTFAGILVLLFSVAAFLGTRIPLMWIFGAAAAVFVISSESAPFKHAIKLGGRKARWWPPLLWVVGWFAIMVVLIGLLGDVEGY